MEQQLPFCPVETTLSLIGDKWKVIIIRDLLDGTKRFGELKKSIGKVSQKVLTAQLREMETMGLLTRKVYAVVPPKVEYTLTTTGYSLKPILDAMKSWGIQYKKDNNCFLNAEILGLNNDIAHVQSKLVMIDDLSSAIELMHTVKDETNCSKIIIYETNLSASFFKMSTNLAVEIFRFYLDYNIKLAIIGEFSKQKNKALQDFILSDSNSTNFFLLTSIDDAVDCLN